MAILRLDKFLAEALCESRSDVRKYIKYGKITIDGEKCIKADTKVNTEKNIVFLGTREVKYKGFVYIMLNKPADVVSATEDKEFKTVIDLIKKEDKVKGLFPVGRLDKDTVGLIILTNNGSFAHNTLSPKKHIAKTYYVELDGKIEDNSIESFKDGISIKDKDGKEIKLKSAYLEILSSSDEISKANITITEGKFHQIKKMFATIGLKVTYLKRLKFGDISLDEALAEGEYRFLNEKEMEYIESFL